MRSIRTLLAILSLTLLASLTTWVYAQPVHIPDPNLRAAVRHTLELPGGVPIRRDAMLRLTNLALLGILGIVSRNRRD